jgi:hypothetical protein
MEGAAPGISTGYHQLVTKTRHGASQATSSELFYPPSPARLGQAPEDLHAPRHTLAQW